MSEEPSGRPRRPSTRVCRRAGSIASVGAVLVLSSCYLTILTAR